MGQRLSFLPPFQVVLALSALLSLISPAQQPKVVEDPLQQKVGQIELDNQTVVDGIAMLSNRISVAVSVEFPLGATISSPAPALKLFTERISPGTAAEVLDRLCALDPTFTWVRNRNTVNVFPRAVEGDPLYLMNRKIEKLTFQDVHKVDDAVMSMVGQLPGPRQQLAVMQVGMPLDFARALNTTVSDITFRQALDDIAQQLGPSYGWILSGGQDFRIVTFHERILPKPSRPQKERPRVSGG